MSDCNWTVHDNETDVEDSTYSHTVAVPTLFEVIAFIYLMIFSHTIHLLVNIHSLFTAWPLNGNLWLVTVLPAFGVCYDLLERKEMEEDCTYL